MIFDTHAHCYWDSLLPRIDEVVFSMQKNGVTKATQIGCDIKTSTQAITLARAFPGIFYATVGLHPETAQDNYELGIMNYEGGDSCLRHREEGSDLVSGKQDKIATLFAIESGDFLAMTETTLTTLEKLIQDNHDVVVAVGECGFDFHYLDGTDGGKVPADFNNLTQKAQQQIENQKYWWLAQWRLAQKYNLPLIIHTRDARDATLEFMKSNSINRCVMHCYSEDWELACELLEFSDEIYFSFSGILTYKKSEKIQEAAKRIPIDRILVETDAPFLAPQAVRGQVNEPAHTRYTLEKLAELRGIQVEEIEDVIYENSLRFYRLR